jgi:hypothetical protein
MKEKAEIGLRKTEVTDVDIRVRQETDWKESLSIEVVGSCGRAMGGQAELRNELAANPR